MLCLLFLKLNRHPLKKIQKFEEKYYTNDLIY